MDPLSVTVNLLALMAATNQAVSGLHKLWKLRHAPTHLDALQNEATDFQVTLTFVKDALMHIQGDKASDLDLGVVWVAVQRGADVVAELQELIDTRLTRANSEKGGIGVRYVGFLKKERIDRVVSRLRDVRVGLGTALTAINYLQMRHETPRLHLAIQSVSVSSPVTDSTTTSTTTSPQSQEFETQIGEGTKLDPNLMQSFSQAMTVSGGDTKQTGPSMVRIQATPAVRHCEPFCPCRCHVRVRGQTPRWMQAVFGVLFWQFTGTPLLNRQACNVSRCRYQAGSLKFEYCFPTAVLPWILRVMATWNDVEGVGGSWSLRVPEHLPHNNGLYTLYRHTPGALAVEKYLDSYKLSARAIQPEWGLSILDSALSNRRIDICLMLINRGADLHFERGDGMTTAQYAWKHILAEGKGSNEFTPLRPLLMESDTLDTLSFSPAHRIVTGLSHGDLEQELLLHPESVNARDSCGETPLFWAVRRSDYKATTLLLEHGADPNARALMSKTALHQIGGEWSIPCMRALVDAGADVNALDDHTDGKPRSRYGPLNIAITGGSIEVVHFLLDSGADPDGRGICPPLFQAAQRQRLDIMRALVAAGADIDRRASDGATTVQLSVENNAADCVRFLVGLGARLTDVDQVGATVVTLAAWCASADIMRVLARARIRGLPMGKADVEGYWRLFETMRNVEYSGERASIEEERAAFKDLLDSLRPAAEGDEEEEAPEELTPLDDRGLWDSEQSEQSDQSEDDDDEGGEEFVDALEAVEAVEVVEVIEVIEVIEVVDAVKVAAAAM